MLGAAQLPANSTIHYSLEGGRVPDPSPSASQLLKSWGARELLGYFQKRNTENYSIHCPRDPCTPREGLTWNTPTCSPHPRRSSAGASFQMNRSTSPSKTYQLKKVHPTTNPISETPLFLREGGWEKKGGRDRPGDCRDRRDPPGCQLQPWSIRSLKRE